MLITNTDTIATYYQALLDREPSFVGVFFVAVKTTKVFCIATCRARKPKLQNVLFYTSAQEALDNGYRPCKICQPTEYAQTLPTPVVNALTLMKQQDKVTDKQLREQGISPEVVRRWFKQNYGITFHAYQRMHRIHNAQQALKQGDTITDIAFNSGYESLSGFGYAFKQIIGQSPERSSDKNLILMSRLITPIGAMFVCATAVGVCLLQFVDNSDNFDRANSPNGFNKRGLPTQQALQDKLQGQILIGENAHINQCRQQLAEYFAGTRQCFDVPLDLSVLKSLSQWQKACYYRLMKVAFANRIACQQLMADSGHGLQQVTQIANIVNDNPIVIIIPCHRVYQVEGDELHARLQYQGGEQRKQWLMRHELTSLTLVQN